MAHAMFYKGVVFEIRVSSTLTIEGRAIIVDGPDHD